MERLRKAVVDGINEIVNDLCRRAGIRNADIYDSVFVGILCIFQCERRVLAGISGLD